MSFQTIWALLHAHPGKLINLLALAFAGPGAWLLHNTQRRARRALGQNGDGAGLVDPKRQSWLTETAERRMNRFFYRFGFACLAAGLAVSWLSTYFK